MILIKLFSIKLMKLKTRYQKILILKLITNDLDIDVITKVNDYINLENKETIENKIYNSRKDEIEILEDNGALYFLSI